jgi:hypothetical protein
MKLCTTCQFCEIKANSIDPNQYTAICGKTMKVDHENDPKDYVFGGKTTFTYATAQACRENSQMCGPDAQWHTPKQFGGRT